MEDNVVVGDGPDEECDRSAAKQIDRDFAVIKLHNGDWAIEIRVGANKAYVSASSEEVTLWKSREGMYRIFKQIHELVKDGTDGVSVSIKKVLDESRLDKERLK